MISGDDAGMISRALLIGVSVTSMMVGCTGTAKIGFVSLNSQSIDPPRVEPYTLEAQECAWWVDDAGNLNLAMRCRKQNLFLGSYGLVEVEISFALDTPPAGSGRDYPLRHREVRVVVRSALQHQRFTPISGIISVLVKDSEQMHGSFRIWMNTASEVGMLAFLPQRPGPVLCYGTYRAVHDPKRGKHILDRTEEGGWSRPARTTQP